MNDMAGSSDDILVVGAGPAGLAVSACLRAAGLRYTAVERALSVGSSWRAHYDRLHLHTSKRYSALPFTPWPRAAPVYPSRAQMVDYLERYALQHRISPHLGVAVSGVRRAAGRFVVETSAGTLHPRFVVVATGNNAQAVRPDFPGQARFAGELIHARDYRNAAPYAGKRTLVVGCGNSGAEIALDLAEHGVEVALVVRGPVHVVPRDLFGQPTQTTSVLLSGLPLGLRDAVSGAVMRLVVGDLARWGLVRPQTGLNRMMQVSGRVPMLDLGTVARIKAGQIRVVPGAEEVFEDRVRFVDGRTYPFESIILATGYRPGLEQIVDGYSGLSDPWGRPRRLAEDTQVPGLYFVGFRNTSTGALRDIAQEAQRVAAALVRATQGVAAPV